METKVLFLLVARSSLLFSSLRSKLSINSSTSTVPDRFPYTTDPFLSWYDTTVSLLSSPASLLRKVISVTLIVLASTVSSKVNMMELLCMLRVKLTSLGLVVSAVHMSTDRASVSSISSISFPLMSLMCLAVRDRYESSPVQVAR